MDEGRESANAVYRSFLIRCWRQTGREPRIEVEHIQSGGRLAVGSLAMAIVWISARAEMPPAVVGAREDPDA